MLSERPFNGPTHAAAGQSPETSPPGGSSPPWPSSSAAAPPSEEQSLRVEWQPGGIANAANDHIVCETLVTDEDLLRQYLSSLAAGAAGTPPSSSLAPTPLGAVHTAGQGLQFRSHQGSRSTGDPLVPSASPSIAPLEREAVHAAVGSLGSIDLTQPPTQTPSPHHTTAEEEARQGHMAEEVEAGQGQTAEETRDGRVVEVSEGFRGFSPPGASLELEACGLPPAAIVPSMSPDVPVAAPLNITAPQTAATPHIGVAAPGLTVTVQVPGLPSAFPRPLPPPLPAASCSSQTERECFMVDLLEAEMREVAERQGRRGMEIEEWSGCCEVGEIPKAAAADETGAPMVQPDGMLTAAMQEEGGCRGGVGLPLPLQSEVPMVCSNGRPATEFRLHQQLSGGLSLAPPHPPAGAFAADLLPFDYFPSQVCDMLLGIGMGAL